MTTQTRTDPIAATETFVAGLEGLMSERPKTLPSVTVDELMLAYREALGEVPAEVVTAVQSAIAAYDAPSQNRDVALTMGRLGLRHVLAAADRTFVDFAQAKELAEAEAELDKIAAEFDQAMADLRTAVDTADVDAVMRLRPQVEVSLPQRREAAQLAVLDLRIARAERLIADPRKRKAAADEERGAAQARLDEAVELVKRRQQDFILSNSAADATATIVERAERDHQALVAERNRAGDEAARSGRERLLRLAGLPQDEDITTVDDEPVTQPQIAIQRRSVLGGQR
jgi:hypothetical protein